MSINFGQNSSSASSTNDSLGESQIEKSESQIEAGSAFEQAMKSDCNSEPNGADSIFIDHSTYIGVVDNSAKFENEIRLFRDPESNHY